MSICHKYDNGMVRVKVPVPFPLQYVNGYIIPDGDRYTIIDPGLHTSAAVNTWESVWLELGVEPKRIDKIVLTHHHPDHYGLAGWMQQRTGGEVLMSRHAHLLVQRMWGKQETMTEELTALFTAHGLPGDKQAEMAEHMKSFIPLVSPQPESIRYLKEGEKWQAGELQFTTFTVSGHAYNHLVFVDEYKKLMICGDHVLPRISPNISYLPDEDPDPLHSFLVGLDKLAAFNVEVVYPGHRDPFSDLRGRVQDLHKHHADRLQKTVALLDEPANAYMVCSQMYGERLSIHQLRFAMSETIAHLIYLQQRDYVQVYQDVGVQQFKRLRDYLTE